MRRRNREAGNRTLFRVHYTTSFGAQEDFSSEIFLCHSVQPAEAGFFTAKTISIAQ